MTAAAQPAVGAAGFLAALTQAGFDITVRDGFATFAYLVEVGSRTGEQVQLGLAIPGDWPLSPPPGPHVNPRLGHPHGAVHDSPLGPDWEYWSRPVPNWTLDRSLRAYLRHLRALFAQL
jgi:hypothetical protein